MQFVITSEDFAVGTFTYGWAGPVNKFVGVDADNRVLQ